MVTNALAFWKWKVSWCLSRYSLSNKTGRKKLKFQCYWKENEGHERSDKSWYGVMWCGDVWWCDGGCWYARTDDYTCTCLCMGSVRLHVNQCMRKVIRARYAGKRVRCHLSEIGTTILQPPRVTQHFKSRGKHRTITKKKTTHKMKRGNRERRRRIK